MDPNMITMAEELLQQYVAARKQIVDHGVKHFEAYTQAREALDQVTERIRTLQGFLNEHNAGRPVESFIADKLPDVQDHGLPDPDEGLPFAPDQTMN